MDTFPTLSPNMALQRLTSWRKLDVHHALSKLDDFYASTNLLQLFGHYFPRDFARLRRQPLERANSVTAYSQAELEFFRLVEKRLFPIEIDWLAEADERSAYIPVSPQVIEADDIASYKLSWQIIYCLSYGPDAGIEWETIQTSLPGQPEAPRTFQNCINGCYHVRKRFYQRATRCHHQLKHLRLVFQMAQYSTGNVWLDTTYEMLSYSTLPDWSRREIDWLTAEWKKAQRLSALSNQVTDWLDADPARLTELIQLWDACAVFVPAKKGED